MALKDGTTARIGSFDMPHSAINDPLVITKCGLVRAAVLTFRYYCYTFVSFSGE